MSLQSLPCLVCGATGVPLPDKESDEFTRYTLAARYHRSKGIEGTLPSVLIPSLCSDHLKDLDANLVSLSCCDTPFDYARAAAYRFEGECKFSQFSDEPYKLLCDVCVSCFETDGFLRSKLASNAFAKRPRMVCRFEVYRDLVAAVKLHRKPIPHSTVLKMLKQAMHEHDLSVERLYPQEEATFINSHLKEFFEVFRPSSTCEYLLIPRAVDLRGLCYKSFFDLQGLHQDLESAQANSERLNTLLGECNVISWEKFEDQFCVLLSKVVAERAKSLKHQGAHESLYDHTFEFPKNHLFSFLVRLFTPARERLNPSYVTKLRAFHAFESIISSNLAVRDPSSPWSNILAAAFRDLHAAERLKIAHVLGISSSLRTIERHDKAVVARGFHHDDCLYPKLEMSAAATDNLDYNRKHFTYVSHASKTVNTTTCQLTSHIGCFFLPAPETRCKLIAARNELKEDPENDLLKQNVDRLLQELRREEKDDDGGYPDIWCHSLANNPHCSVLPVCGAPTGDILPPPDGFHAAPASFLHDFPYRTVTKSWLVQRLCAMSADMFLTKKNH